MQMVRFITAIVVNLIALSLFISAVFSQENNEDSDIKALKEIVDSVDLGAITKGLSKQKYDDVLEAIKPDIIQLEKKKFSTNQKTLELISKHEEWSLNHRKQVLNYQHVSSIVIFVVVLIIIGFGLFLSYMQFRKSSQLGEQPDKGSAAAAQSIDNNNKDSGSGTISPTLTSISISKDGIQIDSSVIGILILFISLGFFYLYLTTVYPIDEIESAVNKAKTQISETGQKTQ